jgi:hypothetical protein
VECDGHFTGRSGPTSARPVSSLAETILNGASYSRRGGSPLRLLIASMRARRAARERPAQDLIDLGLRWAFAAPG